MGEPSPKTFCHMRHRNLYELDAASSAHSRQLHFSARSSGKKRVTCACCSCCLWFSRPGVTCSFFSCGVAFHRKVPARTCQIHSRSNGSHTHSHLTHVLGRTPTVLHICGYGATSLRTMCSDRSPNSIHLPPQGCHWTRPPEPP